MKFDDENIRDIENRALNMRRNIIRMLAAAGSGHPGGSLGQADIFATLYFGRINNEPVMHYDPLNPLDETRDILVQSNGHTIPVRYAALHEIGVIPEEELLTLRQFGSRLQGHPEREKLPWLETTSGPLGEGLSQAAGMAYVLKNFSSRHSEQSEGSQNDSRDSSQLEITQNDSSRKVFVTLGDGELDEGQNWEAIMFAAKNHLSNLIAIVDRNHIQLSGPTEEIMPLEPLAGKFAAFGWHVLQIDGNDVREILTGFGKAFREKNKPTVILAKTIPGKGVSFMENDYKWHGAAPTKEQAEIALRELDDFAKKENL
jgi:transketolase